MINVHPVPPERVSGADVMKVLATMINTATFALEASMQITKILAIQVYPSSRLFVQHALKQGNIAHLGPRKRHKKIVVQGATALTRVHAFPAKHSIFALHQQWQRPQYAPRDSIAQTQGWSLRFHVMLGFIALWVRWPPVHVRCQIIIVATCQAPRLRWDWATTRSALRGTV